MSMCEKKYPQLFLSKFKCKDNHAVVYYVNKNKILIQKCCTFIEPNKLQECKELSSDELQNVLLEYQEKTLLKISKQSDFLCWGGQLERIPYTDEQLKEFRESNASAFAMLSNIRFKIPKGIL